jgi:hypothetical protein
MMPYWDCAIAPILDGLRPRIILLSGRNIGDFAPTLLGATDAIVHVVDPTPKFDFDAARALAGDRLVLHRTNGAIVVPLIALPDLVLSDGDPNHYATYRLLQTLRRQAARLGRPFPVTLLANAGWPYGRRDSYDDPVAVPAALRRPYERGGIMPGRGALGAGLFVERCNATLENEPGSGVLTALEDFVADQQGALRLTVLPMFHGLGLLHPDDCRLAPILATLSLGPAAARLAADLERARVLLAVERDALRQSLDQAHLRNEALHAALRSEQQKQPDPVSTESRIPATMRRVAGRVLRSRLPSPPAETPSVPDELGLLRSSGMFDPAWYLRTYPDVAAAGVDPVAHFLAHGAEEARDPGPGFSSGSYFADNPDVAASGQNPLLHYLKSGRAEGRRVRPA